MAEGPHRLGEGMTPLLALPPEALPPARGANVEMVVNYRQTQQNVVTEDITAELDYWPSGVDYDKWTPLAKPAPAGTFAETLDFHDLPED